MATVKAQRNNKGQFVKGYSANPETQFKKGVNASPKTQFGKGYKPWNTGLKGVQISTRKGMKLQPLSEETKRKISRPGKLHWNWQDGKPTCLDCGKELSNYNNKKCSEHRGLKGKENPNWNGGKGTERHRLMGQREYKVWREAVFKRDNYTCVSCSQSGYIQADHIKPWADYPELRFDINNGRTLCMGCHYFETFGKSMPKDIKWGTTLRRTFATQ